MRVDKGTPPRSSSSSPDAAQGELMAMGRHTINIQEIARASAHDALIQTTPNFRQVSHTAQSKVAEESGASRVYF